MDAVVDVVVNVQIVNDVEVDDAVADVVDVDVLVVVVDVDVVNFFLMLMLMLMLCC